MSSSTLTDTHLIEYLEQPNAYPHHPEHVEHIQTHISHVFIAAPYVYKIKKPLDLGFLDYSSLERRRHFCEQEVELNQRLCPDLYLGVLPISRHDNGFRFDPEMHGEVVEFAVHMKKLTQSDVLSERVRNDSLTKEDLDRVAERLAAFYLSQHPNPEILTRGEPDRIRTNTDENFEQTEAFVGRTIDRPTYESIRYFTEQYLKRHDSLFQTRIAQERIVDGHGDLHLEHIHVTPEHVCIYDCIEFNERFRYHDLASDLAFLAMDLDFYGREDLDHYFIARMGALLDDPDLERIIDFYKCYRAYVKGKIKSLQSKEEEVPAQERTLAAEHARQYFNLSLRYALLGSRPTVLLFMGAPGSGKSTLAQLTARHLHLRVFSSDSIRKSLAGLTPDRPTPEHQREQVYSSDMMVRTYARLWEHAADALREGKSVVLDATFSRKEDRNKFVSYLSVQEAEYRFIETWAPGRTIRRRLREREHQQGITSDARLKDFRMLLERYEPPDELNPKQLISIDTDQPEMTSLSDLFRELAEANWIGIK